MELVSGPDVGGGFLFQLTVDGDGALRRYTTHVQEGGIDGGDRTAGSPRSLGFAPTELACPLGGRACWHRTLEVPAEGALGARFAYNRLRFLIGPLVAQRAGVRAVPFEVGFAELARRVEPAMSAAGEPWFVGGSAAAAAQGAAIAPRDIDLATSRAGVQVLAEALGDALIEPVSRPVGGTTAGRWGARASLGTLVDGVLAEWSEFAPPGEAYGEWSAETLEHAVVVDVAGRPVPVVPLEYPLAKAAEGRPERLPALLDALRLRGRADRPRLEAAMTAYRLAPAVRDRLTAQVDALSTAPVSRPSAGS